MSNFINPLLIDGYIDDEIGKSVQGAYTGSLDAPQERMVDNILKEERKARRKLRNDIERLYEEFDKTMDKIVSCKKKGRCAELVAHYRQQLLEIKLEIERLEKIRI